MSEDRYFYFSRNCGALTSRYLVAGTVAAKDEADAREKLGAQLRAAKSIDSARAFDFMALDSVERNEFGLVSITMAG